MVLALYRETHQKLHLIIKTSESAISNTEKIPIIYHRKNSPPTWKGGWEPLKKAQSRPSKTNPKSHPLSLYRQLLRPSGPFTSIKSNNLQYSQLVPRPNWKVRGKANLQTAGIYIGKVTYLKVKIQKTEIFLAILQVTSLELLNCKKIHYLP